MSFAIIFGAVVFGTSEGIRQAQAKGRRDEHRSRKNNLMVKCSKSSQFSPLLEGRQVVLSGDKLYIDTGRAYDESFGHPFCGYFLAYPDTKYSGLISSISADEPPMMNWIYVDRDTYEVKFGTRPYAEHQLNGPFDCTRQDRRLNFGGWEGFVVVQEGDFWALYFDRDGDGLKSKRDAGIPVLEVELLRKETRGKPKAITAEPITGEPILKKEEATSMKPMTPPESVRGDTDESRSDGDPAENRQEHKHEEAVDKRVKMEDCEEDDEPNLD